MVQEAKNQLASVVPWRGWSRRALGAPGHRGQRRGSTGRTGAAGGTAGGEEQVGEWRRTGEAAAAEADMFLLCVSCGELVIAGPRPSLLFLIFFFIKNPVRLSLIPFCAGATTVKLFHNFLVCKTQYFSPMWTMTTTKKSSDVHYSSLFAVPTGNFTRLKSATPQGHIRESCSQPL